MWVISVVECNMKKKKLLFMILGVLAVIAAGYLIFWKIYVTQRFGPFLAQMDEGEISMKYENRFTCGVSTPNHITSLRGNLYVTPFRVTKNDENGVLTLEDNICCDLIIFVEFPSGYTVWAEIYDGNENVSTSFFMDENMELLPGNEEHVEEYEKYYNSVYDSYEAANKVFGVFNLPDDRE